MMFRLSFIVIILMSIICVINSNDETRKYRKLIDQIFAESGELIQSDELQGLMTDAIKTIRKVPSNARPIDWILTNEDLEILLRNGNRLSCLKENMVVLDELDSRYGRLYMNIKHFIDRSLIKNYHDCRSSIKETVNNQVYSRRESKYWYRLDVPIAQIDINLLIEDSSQIESTFISLYKSFEVNKYFLKPDELSWTEFYESNLKRIETIKGRLCKSNNIEPIAGLEEIETFIEKFSVSELIEDMNIETLINFRRFIFCQRINMITANRLFDIMIGMSYSVSDIFYLIEVTQEPETIHLLLKFIKRMSPSNREEILMRDTAIIIMSPFDEFKCTRQEMETLSLLRGGQLGNKLANIVGYIEYYMSYYVSNCMITLRERFNKILDLRLTIDSVEQILEDSNYSSFRSIPNETLIETVSKDLLPNQANNKNNILARVDHNLSILRQECQLIKHQANSLQSQYFDIFDKFDADLISEMETNFLDYDIMKVLISFRICDQLHQVNIRAHDMIQSNETEGQ